MTKTETQQQKLTVSEASIIKFWLPGRIAPKARPRFNKRQAYLPSGYRDWKTAACREVLSQIPDRSFLPLQRASIFIRLVGAHRGDLDNIAGAILDTLVEVGVLLDDRVNCLPRLVVEHESKGDRGCWVEVMPL